MDWVMKYDMSHPFTGDVYGGWNDKVVSETTGKGAKFVMRKPVSGFIRQNTSGQEGPPVIMVTKRTVKAGKMKDCIAATQALADECRVNKEGMLALSMAKDDKDANVIHLVEVFANLDGFNALSQEMGSDEGVKAKVEAVRECMDTDKPITGEVWSADGSAVNAVLSQMGTVEVTYYDFPVIGQVDLAKGDKN